MVNSLAPRGPAGRPPHRVENRAWCTDRTPMNLRNNRDQKAALTLALAGGHTVKAWAKDHDVPERTAYTWARSPEVRTQVRRIRRRAVDRAVGQLSRYAAAAAAKIGRLARGAQSESVQLQAARAV